VAKVAHAWGLTGMGVDRNRVKTALSRRRANAGRLPSEMKRSTISGSAPSMPSIMTRLPDGGAELGAVMVIVRGQQAKGSIRAGGGLHLPDKVIDDSRRGGPGHASLQGV